MNGRQIEKVSGSCFSTASLEALEKIHKALFERKPISYMEEWLEGYTPNQDYYLPADFRKQLIKAGKRAGANDPAGTYAHQLFDRLLIDLSYNSSRLEGNTYSLLDTERLLLHGDSAEGKLDEEKVMIINHKEAIRYMVENASKLEISRQMICTLHYLLSDGLLEPKESGKIRKHGVRIGGSVYTPFEGEKRLGLLLEKIAIKGAKIEDPFEQSVFLLIHLSYLQAFTDVNKRTARLSANISLIKNNFVPLAFNDVEVGDYMSAMITIYEFQDVRPIVDLYFYSYMRTCAAYEVTVKALGFDAVRVKYRGQRCEMIREIIVKKKIGEALDRYINSESEKIPEQDRQSFILDIEEDLHQLDESRIGGLGIDLDELKLWLRLYKH